MKYSNGLYYVTGWECSIEQVVNGETIESYIPESRCDFDTEELQECLNCVLGLVYNSGGICLLVYDGILYGVDCNNTEELGVASKTNIRKTMRDIKNIEKQWR